MKVQVRKLIDGHVGLQSMMGLPVTAVDDKLAFALGRLARQVQPEVDLYFQRRQNLIQELGTVDNGAGQQVLDPAKNEEFVQRDQLLLATEIPMALDKLKWSELKKIDSLNLGQIGALEFLINLEE